MSATASDLWEFEEDVGVELAAFVELLLVGGTSAGTMKMMAGTEGELDGIDAGTMKLPVSTIEVLVAWVLAP